MNNTIFLAPQFLQIMTLILGIDPEYCTEHTI